MKHPSRSAFYALGAALALNLCGSVRAAEPAAAPTVLSETPAQHDARMAWFRDARFGMFIHWGLYAVPAGEYNGRTDYGEWFLDETHMPVSQYEKFASQFNPVKFDARAWVRMAKDAGMKYIVITTKHHDGFGLWPSQQSDWNISRTPFQRDPLKELAAACQAEGITLCFYHSIMDWHHSDWGQRRAWNDVATGQPDMDRYTAYLKAQLQELLTGYGRIGILWFDGEWEKPWTHDRGVDVYNFCRTLQPNIIVNNRVGKGRSGMAGMDHGQGVGDYGTPEQEIPPTGFGPGVDWESCMTMNNHWGYNKNDHDWKSAETLVRNLIDCASKGGNYLLNVGPTAEGVFPAASVERLAAIGQWMRVNGDAIYGTTASPFKKLAWGRCTQKADGADTLLYLHVFDWPANGKLQVPGLANKIKSATLLAGGQRLRARQVAQGVEVTVPAQPVDAISTTIVLRLSGSPEVVPVYQRADRHNRLVLTADSAEVTGRELKTETLAGQTNLGFWTEPGDTAHWLIQLNRAGDYEITANLSAVTAGEFLVEVDGNVLAASAPATGAYANYELKSLGVLKLEAGKHTLTVRPTPGKWQPMNLRSLQLSLK